MKNKKIKNKVIELELVVAGEVMDLDIKGSLRNKTILKNYKSFIKKINKNRVDNDSGFEFSWEGYSILISRLSEEIYFSWFYPDDDVDDIKCLCFYSNNRFSMLEISMNPLAGDMNPVQMLSIFLSQNSLDKYVGLLPFLTKDDLPAMYNYIINKGRDELFNILHKAALEVEFQ